MSDRATVRESDVVPEPGSISTPRSSAAGSAGDRWRKAGEARGRRRVSPGIAALLCLLTVATAGVSIVLQSGGFQDWRLSRLSLPALYSELKSQGENSRLLYFIGQRLNQQNRFGEADGYLRQGVGLDRDSARLRDAWAIALLRSGQTTAAFGELREFEGTHPKLADAHLILGKFYYAQGSMDRASKEFEHAIALKPRNANACLYLAGARDSLRDTERAREAAARAVELQPDSAQAHLVLASLSGRVNRPAEEVRCEFEKAVALDPRSAAAHQEFARWLLEGGTSVLDHTLAMQHAARAIELGIHDSTAYLALGRARSYMGDTTGAIEPYAQAARLAPEDPAPALALSQAYRSRGQNERAGDWSREYLRRQTFITEKNKLTQAAAVAPRDSAKRLSLARWLGRHGDIDGSLRNYAAAQRRSIESPQVMVAASNSLVQGGHADLALPLCRRAVALARHSPDVYEALGDALLELRQVDAAVEAYNAAARLDSSRSERLIARSCGFVAAHRDEPAIKAMQIAVWTTHASK